MFPHLIWEEEPLWIEAGWLMQFETILDKRRRPIDTERRLACLPALLSADLSSISARKIQSLAILVHLYRVQYLIYDTSFCWYTANQDGWKHFLPMFLCRPKAPGWFCLKPSSLVTRSLSALIKTTAGSYDEFGRYYLETLFPWRGKSRKPKWRNAGGDTVL